MSQISLKSSGERWTTPIQSDRYSPFQSIKNNVLPSLVLHGIDVYRPEYRYDIDEKRGSRNVPSSANPVVCIQVLSQERDRIAAIPQSKLLIKKHSRTESEECFWDLQSSGVLRVFGHLRPEHWNVARWSEGLPS